MNDRDSGSRNLCAKGYNEVKYPIKEVFFSQKINYEYLYKVSLQPGTKIVYYHMLKYVNKALHLPALY